MGCRAHSAPMGRRFTPCADAVAAGANVYMIISHEKSIAVGKYLVSPLVTRTDSGRYAASVAIQSGHGSATHHRVLRFVPRFDTRAGARRYAVDQAKSLLHSVVPFTSKESDWPRKN